MTENFKADDPSTYPFEMKQWLLGYVTQEIRAQSLTGYRPVFAAQDGLSFTSGTGSPETVISAQVGSLYVRRNGGASTTLYVKESGSGNTGWIAK